MQIYFEGIDVLALASTRGGLLVLYYACPEPPKPDDDDDDDDDEDSDDEDSGDDKDGGNYDRVTDFWQSLENSQTSILSAVRTVHTYVHLRVRFSLCA